MCVPVVIIHSSDICGTSTLVTYYLNFIARQDCMRKDSRPTCNYSYLPLGCAVQCTLQCTHTRTAQPTKCHLQASLIHVA